MVSDPISEALHTHAADLRDSITVQARSMVPGRPFWLGPSPEEIAAATAARAEARAKVERQHAEALAEWEGLRARVQDGPLAAMVLELLDLHKPYRDGGMSYPSTCDHCYEGGYDSGHEEWPCSSYAIIRDGLGIDAPH